MQIRPLILASLTLAGCDTGKYWSSVSGCDPDRAPFSTDEDVDAATLEAVMGTWGITRPEDVTCEQLCEQVTQDRTGWYVLEQTSCEHGLDPDAADTGDTAGTSVVGHVTCEGTLIEYYCEGRRPLGHVEAACEAQDLGAALAAAAHLEAASVIAFRQLVRQLRAWGAPEGLIARCEHAAQDEVRHARDIGALARREGARLPPLRIAPAPEDRLSVALHNASEGCVGESWASLLAFWKAEHALDPALRAAYARVAEDEARHAQLSWDLHAWLMSTLTPAERAEVQGRLARAAARLPHVAEVQATSPPAAFGLPAPGVLANIAQDLAGRLAVALA